jgi:hypothetical protein
MRRRRRRRRRRMRDKWQKLTEEVKSHPEQ